MSGTILLTLIWPLHFSKRGFVRCEFCGRGLSIDNSLPEQNKIAMSIVSHFHGSNVGATSCRITTTASK